MRKGVKGGAKLEIQTSQTRCLAPPFQRWKFS
jgi:hypothetical protein